MKLLEPPPPRPEDEGIPLLLRIPGVLDALLFWSLFTSASVLMLWLLTSSIKNQLSELIQTDIRTQTMLAAEAVGLQEIALQLNQEESEEDQRILSARLTRIVQTNPQILSAALYARQDGRWTITARAGRSGQAFPEGESRVQVLLNQALMTESPVFSAWDFLLRRRLPMFSAPPEAPEFAAQRLAVPPQRVNVPVKVLVLVFDAAGIHSRFQQLDWLAASVISLAIIVATLLALLVRRRSMQREVAERQRLDALDLLGRRDAILARVAASADEMLQSKDPEPACAALMESIREILGVSSASASLAGVPRPFAAEPAPPLVIVAPPGAPTLTLRDVERPGLAGWRGRLAASQAIHGPLELLPPEERLELSGMDVGNCAVLPILSEGSLAGLIVLIDADKARTWDPGLLDTLRLAADLVGAAFRRTDQEQRLMETGKMQALGRMAGGVAHEFNNLLHIISGNLRRLGTAALPADQRGELVEKMIETTERGSRIVEQLLSATRQATPALRPTQLNEVVQKTAYLARPALRKDITLNVELDPQLPPVAMDPAQIQQVILNLLINANDAITGPGAITLSTGRISGTDGKPYIYASVADTGTGIDPRDADHIFDPFFTTKEPGKGTGLGLSTSRGILELHQGSITAANRDPQGAVFTFYLPVKANKTGTQRVQLPPSDRIPVKAGRVLIADDEPLCVDVLKETMEEHGFDCLTASSGEEALAQAEKHGQTIDWVVTDWTMPGLHGRELVQRLRALLPRAGLIVCSGFILEDEQMPEIDALVVKPFNPAALLRTLGEIAEQKKQQAHPAGGTPMVRP